MLKEPEIRLFGRKISLPENGAVSAGREYSGDSSVESSGDCDRCPEVSRGEEREGAGERKEMQGDEDQETEELCETTDVINPNASSESDENQKPPPNDDESVSENQARPENEQSGSAKALKKPDKILPCPRCTSMDTKFCYYNNYNVNQPRHFCKSCQRYWTAGGTMRNVPVGAGRRKNKNSGSGSHCRHITISEALQAAQIDAPNGFHNPNFRPNGTVLSFGPDSPLCESMASALSLAEKRALNGQVGGSDSSECSMRPGDGGKNVPVMTNGNGFPSPVPCIPWHIQWNSPIPVPVPVPTICPPGYPLPYYPTPAPFWNCNVPNAWNVPWLQTPSPQNGAGLGPSPTSPLGKHSRNGELLSPNKTDQSLESESSIVVPKTLRIDDPEDAAKSSIWSTLGIKCDAFRREGLFKALQAKCDEKKPMINTSPLLRANPAALSRSISFRERA